MGRDCPRHDCGGRLYYGDCTECNYRAGGDPEWGRDEEHQRYKERMRSLTRAE